MKRTFMPVILLAIIWGGYYVASQKTVAALSVFSCGFAIRFFTSLLLLLRMAIRKELRQLLQVRFVWKTLLLIGLFGFLLDTTAFLGLATGSAATGTALLKTDVLMVCLISSCVYRIHLTWKQWLCMLLMLIGVFLVLNIDLNELELFHIGNVFFLLSAFFVSLNAFAIRHAQQHPKNPVCDDVVAFYNNGVCMLLFLFASIVSGQISQLHILTQCRRSRLFLLLAVLGQTLVYIVYYYDLRRYPVWLVKVILLLMPVVSSLICVVFFHETLYLIQLIGMAVILLGACGVLLSSRKVST